MGAGGPVVTPDSGGENADVVRVLICDDHVVFRRGLYAVLETETDITVVGEASDGEEAVTLAETLVPDVVLMDVRMPRLGGIEATRRLTLSRPSVRVLMLTVSDEEEDLFEAVKAGARGYLLKEISIEEVADGVRSVMAGNSPIAPSMLPKLLREFTTLAQQASPRLTDRELEVLRLVATGRSNRDVAEALEISENTVKNHVRNILEKLHLHSRMEAVMYAVKENIIDLA